MNQNLSVFNRICNTAIFQVVAQALCETLFKNAICFEKKNVMIQRAYKIYLTLNFESKGGIKCSV